MSNVDLDVFHRNTFFHFIYCRFSNFKMVTVRFESTEKEKSDTDKTEQLNLEDLVNENQSNGLFDNLDPEDGECSK